MLYAPTWYAADYKNNHSSPSYWRSDRLGLTCAQCNSDLQAAPRQPQTAGVSHRNCRNDELLRADAEATARPHRWGAAASDPTFAELANATAAMVADVSAVVTDFMQSLKPFAMVATGDKTDTFRARFPSSRSAYVIEWDLSTLDDALDAMVRDDPLAPTRVERREYYLGGYEKGESARAFVKYLQSLTADPTPMQDVPSKPPVRVQTTQKGLEPARR